MRKSALRVLLRYLIIGVMLPCFVQYVIYFRFTGNYMIGVFSEKTFTEFYGQNVFRYRVLGKNLHLWVYHKLKGSSNADEMKANTVYDKRLTALDPNADNTFYLTYFIIGTLFSILTALALLYLFDYSGFFEITDQKKIFITSTLTLLSGFLGFVITPYDNITYFFMVVNVLLFLKFLESRQWMFFVLFNLSLILSVLNHESAVLSLSFVAAVYISYYGIHIRWIRLVVIPFACFIFTWLALRAYLSYSGPGVVTEGLKLMRNLNLNLSGMMGIAFAVITIYFLLNISDSPQNKKIIWNYLLMASPYIIMIPVIGIMIEARLWMPVIIGGVLLSQLNYAAIHSHTLQDPVKNLNSLSRS